MIENYSFFIVLFNFKKSTYMFDNCMGKYSVNDVNDGNVSIQFCDFTV